MRYWLVLLLCICASDSVFAQQTIQGRVIEDKTQVALGNINILNLNSQQRTLTDGKGNFAVAAKVNDLVVFSSFGYFSDTVLITDLKPREIFLIPIGHPLKEVKVNAFGKVNKQATAIPYDKDYHGQTMQYQPDEKYEGYYKGGIILRTWLSKREEHDRKKLAGIAYVDEVSKHIAKTFSNENVGLYVPLKGKELDTFILMYAPNIKTFTGPGFDLLDYLNKSYREFIKLPLEKRQKGTIFN